MEKETKQKKPNFIVRFWRYMSTHGLGFRALKTVFTVAVCLGLGLLIRYPSKPFYACITAIIVMQNTPQETLRTAVERIVGTVIGGLLGLAIVPFVEMSGYNLYALYGLLLVGMLLSFVICNLVRFKKASAMSAIVLLALLLTKDQGAELYIYVLLRSAETLAGAVIAALINIFILVPKKPATEQNV